MNRVIKFLLANGYSETENQDPNYRSFEKKGGGLSILDVSEDEIVFIGEEGDWLHINCNIYALIGALIHFRETATNYVSDNIIDY